MLRRRLRRGPVQGVAALLQVSIRQHQRRGAGRETRAQQPPLQAGLGGRAELPVTALRHQAIWGPALCEGFRVQQGQVQVPWLSRVAFQSLLPQALDQQRDHSMVAGDEGGDRGGWQGGGAWWRGERGREGGRRRREGRVTAVCVSVRLVRLGTREGRSLGLRLLLKASGPRSPTHSHKSIICQLLPQQHTLSVDGVRRLRWLQRAGGRLGVRCIDPVLSSTTADRSRNLTARSGHRRLRD